MGILTKNTKASAMFVFVTLVIEAMGFGIIMPVLPDVIRKFITDPDVVTKTFGYFIAVYALLQFVLAPVLGRLSDKYGRRPVLLVSLLGTGVDYLFMALAPTLPLLFVGRVISGICGASFTVVSAYMADISDDTNRSKNFGLIGAGFGVGFILGPAVGGLASSHGLMYPFIIAACLNLLNFLFGFFILPESLAANLRRDFTLKDLNPLNSLKVLTTMPAIALLVVAHFMIQLAGQTHPSIWAIYSESRFSWTAAQVGTSLAVVGVLHVFSQGILTGPMVKKFGERNLVLYGTIGEAIAFAFFGLASTGLFMYATLVVSCIFGAANPALQSLISREIPAEKQGELQGALMSLMSLSAIINPLVMTTVMAKTLTPNSAYYLPGTPYYLAAVIAFFAVAAIWKWDSKHPVVQS